MSRIYNIFPRLENSVHKEQNSKVFYRVCPDKLQLLGCHVVKEQLVIIQ
ncbi:hypothetical protein SAMD00079811_72740 [Scytonema sp. HK-05]|nr:hypothetical protein SAMD00079811_72740 [Scytonema sp. HK-05]